MSTRCGEPATPCAWPCPQAQCGEEALVVRDGQVLACLDLGSGAMPSAVAPRLVGVQPLAVTPSWDESFLVTGYGVGDSHDELFARHRGAPQPPQEQQQRQWRCPRRQAAGCRVWPCRLPAPRGPCAQAGTARCGRLRWPLARLLLPSTPGLKRTLRRCRRRVQATIRPWRFWPRAPTGLARRKTAMGTPRWSGLRSSSSAWR